MSALMQDIAVDVGAIEKRLAQLWADNTYEGELAVTRAALWNVVAHTWDDAGHAHANEVLGRVTEAVPQRTIIVCADTKGKAQISARISANCHPSGGGRQVCSEEISISAGGENTERVPPLVNALLLPDMPVAVWWIGDLPEENAYIEALFEAADRLIVDSSQFNSPADLDLVARIASQTTTAPADLTWARLEEVRTATAALFDPADMRRRLKRIAHVKVASGGGESFGGQSEAILYLAWLTSQLGYEPEWKLENRGEVAGIAEVEIRFQDASTALIRHDQERGVVISNTDGTETTIAVDCVTRSLGRGVEDLIVRLLKRPEADRVYLRALKVAGDMARKL